MVPIFGNCCCQTFHAHCTKIILLLWLWGCLYDAHAFSVTRLYIALHNKVGNGAAYCIP